MAVMIGLAFVMGMAIAFLFMCCTAQTCRCNDPECGGGCLVNEEK